MVLDGGGGITVTPETVQSTLSAIHVDQDTIDQIKSVIRGSHDTLDTPLDTMDSAPLEGSTGGESFASNANLAREHLIKALQDMMTGLSGFEASVTEYGRVQDDNDTNAAAEMHRINTWVNASEVCTTGPEQGTNSTCGPIDTSGEDG